MTPTTQKDPRHVVGAFTATDLTLYLGGPQPVLNALSTTIANGAVTAVVGPNACGKSTLLRTFARILTGSSGAVMFDGLPVQRWPRRAFAKRVALLAQESTVPEGVRVRDLVSRGRYPHQTLLRQWSSADDQAVQRAMRIVGVETLADRVVADLSGGQRQRVRIAMALAQETNVLLLDEPTTALDIEHQYEVLELCRRLNRDHGTTIVAVLHDLGHAARYADHIIALRAGAVVAAGAPAAVITPSVVRQVFGIDCVIGTDPVTNTPVVYPVMPGEQEHEESHER